MTTHIEQIEALYDFEKKREFIKRYGMGDALNDRKLFTITFDEFFNYCQRQDLNPKVISSQENTFDGCYFIEKNGKWFVYDQSKGCKYEMQEFNNYEQAFKAAAYISYLSVKQAAI